MQAHNPTISLSLSLSSSLKKHHLRPSFTVNCSTTTTNTNIIPAFSISDSELSSRGFALHRTFSTLDLDALNSIFARVGFPRRDPSRILLALEHTQALVWIDDAARTGKPVAFARATGDGVFNAVVWDVVVDPSFQGMGLGKAVMERLVADLVGSGVMNIGLFSEPRVVGFYRPLGFVADADGIKAMVYSRKNNKK